MFKRKNQQKRHKNHLNKLKVNNNSNSNQSRLRVNKSHLNRLRVNRSHLSRLRVNKSQLKEVKVNRSHLNRLRVNKSQLKEAESDQKPSEQAEGEQKPTEPSAGEQKPSEQSEEQKLSEQTESEQKPSGGTEEGEIPEPSSYQKAFEAGQEAEKAQQEVTQEVGGSVEQKEAKKEEEDKNQNAAGEQKTEGGSEDGIPEAVNYQKAFESQQEGDKSQQEEGDKNQNAAEGGSEDGIPEAVSYQKAFESEQEGDKSQQEEGDKNQNAEEETPEEGEQKQEDKEEEPKIPDDFYYGYEDIVSRPVVTAESGLPEDLLSLQHMFGYDCTKRANLHMLDDRTVIFAAGNLVQILDLQTKEQKYIRSTSGGGIGAITVHPTKKYFVVAEKGDAPNINIFEYPSLKLYRILRGGTQKSYSYVDFSVDGELLASQGGDPDFMLTVWNWKQEQTVLRSKAFSQDVFRATFSTELEGQLTTAGTGHIRFWKMADTFTGLKLQGELGKFGKTEITDIEGYVELPDGKVLSGSEWGNMLLWDGGLIKVEIGRKNKKPCHHGDITQILLDEGELMTIGIDGYIRVWDFESIDTADSTDESGLFEMEPMNELRVGADVHLRSITKSVDAENEITNWYAQDANGGIWKLDLSFSHTSMAPEKLFTYHAGPILGCDVSPISHLVATTGTDHTVRVYDYIQQKQLHEAKFPAGGSCLKWAPQIVDPKGATFLAGFMDGVLRIFKIANLSQEASHRRHKHDIDLDLKQVFKPHNKKITSMAIDSKGELLATGGEDNSIFFMSIGETYEAIGFINTPTAVRQLQWSPDKFSKTTLLVFCDEGIVLEVEAPDSSKIDTAHTYLIPDLKIKTQKFKSIKSRVRHEEDLAKKAKEEEERKKKEEEERRKRIERGLETESEQGDEEGEEDKEEEREEEWKPFIPEEPSPILDGFYTEEGKFWLSMGGFDAGYIYEYQFISEEEREKIPEELRDEPVRLIPVEESKDIPIRIMKYSINGKQMLFGMEDGSVRIQNLETEYDLSAMGPFWNLTMHDNDYGHITGICPSYDGKMLLTVGADGNFFLYNYMEQEKIEEKVKENKAKLPSAKKGEDEKRIDDIDDPNAYSIEDAKQKAEHDKMMKQAEEKKREEFEMDREIKIELQQQRDDRIETVRKELAWEAEKQRIALEKLRKRFKDVVECERIVVKAFQTPHEAASPPPGAKTGAAPAEANKEEKGGESEVEDIEEELTPLEIQIRQAEEIRLTYEQDRIIKRIEELLKNFDAELRLLRHDKFKLDIVLEVQGKLDSKKKEIEKLQEKERQLYATFMHSLGDNNKFGDYLTKVFKKRIKRAKKKTTEGEDSDEDSDDDSDWDEDEDESDEEAGGFDLDICPPGCDQNLYDNTCQLREKRLDIEEALTEEKKNNEALKKEVESLNKKSKVIDSALKTAQNDLEAFQLEKQQKLNDLDVVVTLKLHQIQYMINGVLPQDLGQTLVFESNGVTRLQQRIKELEHEKHLQKKHMKESRKTHVQLIKDRKVFESKLIEMEEQCNTMMIGKFGRIVDLEKLETITFNRSIEEQKERLRLTEIQCSEEQLEWDGEEYSGARKSDVREKQRLIQLVQLQAQEIDALKEEIMLLSRKGGHILPPAQPPLPQSPANMRTISN
ncbi:hypothetical protein KUTeg_006133 [Tegillarca granosa]|uniref:Cilia- and flagella-associated protein 44 n=1 Tax=Tegillarca granosa TaxID=220873 RepID=A0ABQ9FFM6_TEGGR|nr:hypothetical protein KUTeg_006133 [Tegillarca granosa]